MDKIIRYTTVDTPIGTLHAAFSAGVLCWVSVELEADFLQRIEAEFSQKPLRDDGALVRFSREITNIFTENTRYTAPLSLAMLTPFQQAVLTKTAEIPRGQVRSYGWIAKALNHPNASRAVGTALAKNPLPFVIPCHRVIRADGRLGAYTAGGGTLMKARLLAFEGVTVAQNHNHYSVPKPFEPLGH
ncbi:MAG: methylated-DNA--[protein]-cysteine S-methyltransferase [Halothiobacillus sp.]